MTEARRRAGSRPVTLADVARLAGVSASAVSRTLTAGASVSPATREQVQKAISLLKYRPNRIARSLSTSRSGIIGVAVTHLDNEFYPTFIEELSSQLAVASYRMLLFVTRGALALDPLVDELLAHRLDGLVLASSSLSSKLAKECKQYGIPVVMFNNTDVLSDVASVAGDNFAGGRTVAHFLIAGGHERYAFIAGVEDSSATQEREAGFMRGLLEGDLPRPLRACGSYTFVDAAVATRELLRRDDAPDAIFCANDQMALSALQVAQFEFGLAPGRDVSVVGFDDVPVANWPAFSLTTFSQPLKMMACRVAELVLGAASGKPILGIRERIAGELIVRTSTRRPRTGISRGVDGSECWKAPADAAL